MLSARGRDMVEKRQAEIAADPAMAAKTSFSVNLNSWLTVADAYESGGHMYYTTMPTDGIRDFEAVAQETVEFGLDNADAAIKELGEGVREACKDRGLRIVAAEGYQAPGVVVVHAPDASTNFMCEFADTGTQVAGGVPYLLGEPGQGAEPTFRFGLFGLDKIIDVPATVKQVADAMDAVGIHPKN
jgi:aspartate aminotransferase-like enzyme